MSTMLLEWQPHDTAAMLAMATDAWKLHLGREKVMEEVTQENVLLLAPISLHVCIFPGSLHLC